MNGFIFESRLVASSAIQVILLVSLLFLLYFNNDFLTIPNGVRLPLAVDIKIVCNFCPKALESAIISKLQDLASFEFSANGWMTEFSTGGSIIRGTNALYCKGNSNWAT